MTSKDNSAGSTPRKVLLFSGHMIDAPDRAKPRFPADQEPVAAQAIARTLEDIGINGADLAICGGACGGDLLFAEAALARGAMLEIYIPFDETTFLQKSVDFADADWRSRYFAAKSHPNATLQVAPEVLGPLRDGADPYERNNVWMLDSAMRHGARIDFICLWNGQGGDGPGGTQHMMQEVERQSGRVHWLDTMQLWTPS